MMDKAVSIVMFEVLAFLLRYTWRAFRAPTLEDVLDNIGAPKALAEHTDYFKTKEVVKVGDMLAHTVTLHQRLEKYAFYEFKKALR